MTPQPTTPNKPLCKDAWAVPPSPLMLKHGNDYHTCSVCGEKCDPSTTDTPNKEDELRQKIEAIVVRHNGDRDDAETQDHLDLIKSHTTSQLKAQLDELQVEDWKDDHTQLNITRHDFYQMIEAKRNALGIRIKNSEMIRVPNGKIRKQL